MLPDCHELDFIAYLIPRILQNDSIVLQWIDSRCTKPINASA